MEWLRMCLSTTPETTSLMWLTIYSFWSGCAFMTSSKVLWPLYVANRSISAQRESERERERERKRIITIPRKAKNSGHRTLIPMRHAVACWQFLNRHTRSLQQLPCVGLTAEPIIKLESQLIANQIKAEKKDIKVSVTVFLSSTALLCKKVS